MARPRERTPRLATADLQPWEIARLDVSYHIRFYGHVEQVPNTDRAIWSGGNEVLAVAYDGGSSCGFANVQSPFPALLQSMLSQAPLTRRNTANLRLWASRPIQGFDLNSFNAGNYEASVQSSSEAENIVGIV